MYLLIAERYWQAPAKILKILAEYSTFFCSFSNKTYIVNAYFTEPTRTIFRSPFLTLFLTAFKLSISLQSSGSMSHILGLRNERLLLPWYTDFTSGFGNLEISLKLY